MKNAFDKINKYYKSSDIPAYYESIFEFTAVGLQAANNPILKQILVELMPNLRRIRCASLALKLKDKNSNLKYFRTIVECLKTRDEEKAVGAFRNFFNNEKDYAIIVADEWNSLSMDERLQRVSELERSLY